MKLLIRNGYDLPFVSYKMFELNASKKFGVTEGLMYPINNRILLKE